MIFKHIKPNIIYYLTLRQIGYLDILIRNNHIVILNRPDI